MEREGECYHITAEDFDSLLVSIQVIQCEVQCVFIHKLGVVTKWPLGNVEFKILDLILNEVSESQSEYFLGKQSCWSAV